MRCNENKLSYVLWHQSLSVQEGSCISCADNFYKHDICPSTFDPLQQDWCISYILCIALIHQTRRTNSSPPKRMKKYHMNSCLKLKNFRSILKAKIRKHTEDPLAWLVTLYELGVLVAFGLISSLLKFVNSNWLGDTWKMVEESWKGSEILKLW